MKVISDNRINIRFIFLLQQTSTHYITKIPAQISTEQYREFKYAIEQRESNSWLQD